MSDKIKRAWLIPYSDCLIRKNQGLWCKLCQIQLVCTKKSHIDQHVKSVKHLKTLAGPPPETVKEMEDCMNESSKAFYEDLCQAFIVADIPFKKLNDPVLRSFLEKYCKRSVPDESAIRQTYLHDLYSKTLSEIRFHNDKHIWVSVDETVDSRGLSVMNVVIGTLTSDLPSKPYLFASKVLEETNAVTISNLIETTLDNFFDNVESKSTKTLLMVTEGTAYMRKAGRLLKSQLQNMIHITCFAHGLHQICDFIRESFGDVDLLINEVYEVFLKKPYRICCYKDQCPDLPLPPQPDSWVEAAMFYADNFAKIKNIIENLEDSAQTTETSKRLLQTPQVIQHLIFIKKHFGQLPQVIVRLESQQLPLIESMSHFNNTVSSFDAVPGEFGVKLRQLRQRLLCKNPGYNKLNEIDDVLRKGNNSTADAAVPYKCYTFAPVTRCAVEQTFSGYKDSLLSKWSALKTENLEKVLVIHCNSHNILCQ